MKNKLKLYYIKYMICIQRFNEISIKNRSLILCDIDDTIFDYGFEVEQYWKSKIHDPEYKIWKSIIERLIPRLTNNDIYDFINEAIKNECEIHFITHRNILFKDITYLHLNHFNITGIPVHFLTGSSKSQYINMNFNLDDYNKIIFIDDSQHNIDDVSNNVIKCDVYKFVKK